MKLIEIPVNVCGRQSPNFNANALHPNVLGFTCAAHRRRGLQSKIHCTIECESDSRTQMTHTHHSNIAFCTTKLERCAVCMCCMCACCCSEKFDLPLWPSTPPLLLVVLRTFDCYRRHPLCTPSALCSFSCCQLLMLLLIRIAS